jgi:hypothetical protein
MRVGRRLVAEEGRVCAGKRSNNTRRAGGVGIELKNGSLYQYISAQFKRLRNCCDSTEDRWLKICQKLKPPSQRGHDIHADGDAVEIFVSCLRGVAWCWQVKVRAW